MESKVALLSLLAFIPAIGIHLFLCRIFNSQKAVRWMFLSFVLYVIGVSIYWGSGDRIDAKDLTSWLTLFATMGFLCLSYMEAFSMLCRGFSLSIMVYLAQKPNDSIHGIINNYGGVGAQALLNKRLSTLESLALVDRSTDRLRLSTAHALCLARLTLCFKRLLRLGMGG